MSRFRIGIMGIGGTGGYLGGMLAAQYAGSAAVEITFFARGENLDKIKSSGLILRTDEWEKTAYPFDTILAGQATGTYDLLICCVKSNDLEQGILALKGCIHASTIILPFLNGVDATERIRASLPQLSDNVLTGCCYILARLERPGEIKVSGPLRQFYLGASTGWLKPGITQKIAQIFTDAGIDAKVARDIDETLWTKFLFISPMASLTSALDRSLGEVLASKESKEVLISLIRELKGLAAAKGIVLPEDIEAALLAKMELVPFDGITSMHADLRKNKPSEIQSLTGYVVRQGERLHFPVPVYQRVLAQIIERWNID
jgi:2-dehydropantoate 2-reductase